MTRTCAQCGVVGVHTHPLRGGLVVVTTGVSGVVLPSFDYSSRWKVRRAVRRQVSAYQKMRRQELKEVS
jgi:hypothetical protein